jgi:DHA1 family tetracycline resistance protein-like MFS transporter
MLRHYPGVLIYAFSAVLFLVGNNVYPSTWSFYMTAKFEWSTGMIGMSLVATGIAMAGAQAFLTGRLSKRLGELNAALLGLCVAVVMSILYAFIAQPWMVFVLAFVGALQAITYPALNALMSKQVPANAQGELQGGIASLSSIANIVGPLIMTQTMAFYTAASAPIYFPGAAFILAASINALGFMLLFLRGRRS